MKVDSRVDAKMRVCALVSQEELRVILARTAPTARVLLGCRLLCGSIPLQGLRHGSQFVRPGRRFMKFVILSCVSAHARALPENQFRGSRLESSCCVIRLQDRQLRGSLLGTMLQGGRRKKLWLIELQAMEAE